jgi:hypothetical protein
MSHPWPVLLLVPVLLLLSGVGWAQERTPSPEGAKLYIISPVDGAAVENPITVRFGLRGMGVAPAGVATAATGHHHLLVDAELPDLDRPIPSDDRHRHFGGGQTEVSLELAPGTHTLQLLLGDRNHVPHDPPVLSPRITVIVR